MSQVLTKRNLMKSSLWGADDPRTVLLRMAANQERAERLRLLKAETPGVTWRQVAEHCNVVERSVYGWLRNGAMEYDNAVKVAEFFSAHGRPTRARWLYFGNPAASPDLMDAMRTEEGETVSARLSRIETMLAELLARTATPAEDQDVAPETVAKVARRRVRQRPPGGQRRSA
jgi:hypothetical protein